MRISSRAFLFFLVGCLLSFGDSPSQELSPACKIIDTLCKKSGFLVGAAPLGYGYLVHCIQPILRGIARHPGANKPLPGIDPKVVAACRSSAPAKWKENLKGTPLQQWDIIDGESNLGIIRDWPQDPPSFSIPDYSKLAQAYEKVTFLNPDPRTHRWVQATTRANYRGESILQPAFLLDNRWSAHASFSESLVVFPGILSSAMRGVDMTDLPVQVQLGNNIETQQKNIVRMIKAYYHLDPVKSSEGLENGLFTDHFVDTVGSGSSFWYLLGPNVYAMQIQSLFEREKVERGALPSEPSLDELTQRMANTLVRISEFLKGSRKTAVPSFDFSGVRLMNGTFKAWDPNCRDVRNQGSRQALDPSQIICDEKELISRYEPDSAGAFAMIGVMAYDRWKDPKYLAMAESALNFLSQYDRNPVYELNYNFGVAAAARMNRIHNKNVDIHKLMRWAFVRSELKNINPDAQATWPNFLTNARPDVGLLSERWGNFPVHGLWGAKRPYGPSGRGYVFLMNTLTQAINLAPVAKYYPGYATLMGKYLLHVASNTRFFFPNQIARVNQHPKSLSKLDTLIGATPELSSIPYEGLKPNARAGAMATGDALDFEPNWAETNQSFYSGALTGMFASMMFKSNEEDRIPFWDLNISDFQSSPSYPTYLVYNPTASTKTVSLSRNKIRHRFVSNSSYLGVWDSVAKLWLTGSTGDIQTTLEPGQVRVITLVPGGHVSVVEQGKMLGYDHNLPDKPFAATIDYEFR